jgi:ATP-binding cassette subfamily F protein uup
LQALERALADFPGCALVVSHDRFFLDQVATSMLVFSADGRVRQIPGNYSDYLEAVANESPAADSARVRTESEAPAKKRAGLSYNEKKEWEGMEAAVAAKEAQAQAAEAALLAANSGGNYLAIKSATEAHAALQAEVEALYARWESLEAKQRGV